MTHDIHNCGNQAQYVLPAPRVVSLPVQGTEAMFPVRRIFCVARNYEAHAREMGFSERELPFFFMKPADALVSCRAGETARMPYPSLTKDLHHEVELVVALQSGGRRISVHDAMRCVYGYAVGLDMTRRDLQMVMKKQGRPWDIGKGFDAAAPIGVITPIAQTGDIASAEISLVVNDKLRQHSCIDQLIWNVAETISVLSEAWELAAGDLIFTGTPEGVASVVTGDFLHAKITGLNDLRLRITDSL